MIQPRWTQAAGLIAALLVSQAGLTTPATAQDGGPKPDDLFKQLDKNGDGKLTADEIPEAQRRFFERTVRVGDKDSDGALTLSEFTEASKPQDNPSVPLGSFGGAGAPGDLKQRFEMMDRNKDGKVTVDEVPEPFRERVKDLFERVGKTEMTFEEFQRAGGGARPEPGQMFSRLDTNNDGKLTRSEIPEPLRERLGRAFDALGKEELTREDLADVMRRMMGAGGDAMGRPGEMPERDGMRPRVPPFIALLDTNSDGSLSKEELSKAGDKFSELDRNGDGRLDPREIMGPGMEGFMGTGGRPASGRPEMARPEGTPEGQGEGRQRASALFSRMDANGDGKISKEEAPERMKENFLRLDRDGDGFLTMEEMRRGFEELGRGRTAPEGAGNRPEGENSRPRRPAAE